MLRLAVATIALLALAACGDTRERYAFEPSTCAAELTNAGARCGHVRVPEDYMKPSGRSIALNVVVLPAIAADGRNQAQFELEGGPGLAVTATVGFYATDGAAYRQKRDIVFVDLRGAGGSHPLLCPDLAAAEAAAPWAEMYDPEQVGACAAALGAHADLSQYTTINAVRDLDAVREALGYERIVLNALSYGTTLALAYIAEHGDRVRAAVLTGPVPASRTPPRFHATAAQAALDHLFAACAADRECHAAFPDPAADLAQARAHAGARTDVFMERVRTQLYSAEVARSLPRNLHRAAAGDFAAFEPPRDAPRPIADGPYLSITCAESFPHFDLEAARTVARTTLFGDYRLRRQAAACELWNVAPSAPPSPSRSQTPVLFISGEFDPVTPPAWVDELLPLFPNGRHVVLPGGGHIVDGMSDLDTCFDPMVVAFFDSGDTAALDTDCVARMRPPAFATR